MNHVAPIRRSYPRDTAECGHGTCGAVVDCTGECALKAAVINLPVIDEKFLDSQINDMPIQYADEEFPQELERDAFWLKWAAAAVGGGLLIAAVLYVTGGVR